MIAPPRGESKEDQALQRFEIESDYEPTGDQPAAIDELVRGLERRGTRVGERVVGVGGT